MGDPVTDVQQVWAGRTRTPRERVPRPVRERDREPIDPADVYLTVDQIAGLLNLSRMTVYRLITDGDLIGHRIGRSLRVHRDDFDTYMSRTRTTTVTRR